MVAFATTEQMSDRSRGAITATSHPALERELEAATQAIRNVCGWHIAPVEEVTYSRRARIPSVVFLTGMKFGPVTAAKVDGRTLDAESVELDPVTGEVNLYGRHVDVTFTCGFETIPADLEALTLDMVSASLGGAAEGLEREQAGAVSVSYKTYAESEVRGRLSAYVVGRIP